MPFFSWFISLFVWFQGLGIGSRELGDFFGWMGITLMLNTSPMQLKDNRVCKKEKTPQCL